MNRFMTQLVLVAVVGLLCLAGSALAATTQYFDVVPTTANIDGGSANWEDADWKSAATATSGTAWGTDNNAFFEPITVGSPTTTITLSTPVTTTNIQFLGAGYTISGSGSLTSSATAGFSIDAIQASGTINTTVHFLNESSTGGSLVTGGNTLTFGGVVNTDSGFVLDFINSDATAASSVIFNGTGTVVTNGVWQISKFVNSFAPGIMTFSSGDAAPADIRVGSGSFTGTTGVLNWNSTGTLTEAAGGTLYAGNGSTGIINQTAGIIDLYGGSSGNSSFLRFLDPSGNSAYNLNGGTLKLFNPPTADSNNGKLNFGGGTVQAAGTLSIGTGITYGVASGATARIDTNGFAVTISGAITGASAAGLAKTGTGTLTLSGANTYAGVTDIEQGALTLSGSAVGTVTGGLHVATGATFNPGATYTVGSGNTLGGGGTVNASVDASGATIAPGDPASMTIIGGLTLDSSSVLDFEFASDPAGGDYDKIVLSTAGTRVLTLDGTLDVINDGGLNFGTYTLVSGATGITDNGLNLIFPEGFNGVITNNGSSVFLTITEAPEPASLSLLVLGGGMILARRRHTRKA